MVLLIIIVIYNFVFFVIFGISIEVYFLFFYGFCILLLLFELFKVFFFICLLIVCVVLLFCYCVVFNLIKMVVGFVFLLCVLYFKLYWLYLKVLFRGVLWGDKLFYLFKEDILWGMFGIFFLNNNC